MEILEDKNDHDKIPIRVESPLCIYIYIHTYILHQIVIVGKKGLYTYRHFDSTGAMVGRLMGHRAKDRSSQASSNSKGSMAMPRREAEPAQGLAVQVFAKGTCRI